MGVIFFEKLWQEILEKNNHTIPGIPEISTANFLVTNIIANPPDKSISTVLYLVKNSIEAKRSELLLKYWNNIYPHSFDVINLQSQPNSWILPLANKNLFILIVTPEQLETITPYDINESIKSRFKLEKNLETKIIKIKKLFIDNSYLENAYVDEIGTFAVRGSIIDIWPHGLRRPIRIEVDMNNKIESIYSFDNFGKKIKDIESITFPTISEVGSPLTAWLNKFDIGFASVDAVTYELWKTYKQHWPKLNLHLSPTPAKNINEIQIDFDILNKNISTAKTDDLIKKYKPKHIITKPKFIYAENWYSKKLDTLCLTHGTKQTKTASSSQKQPLFTKNIKTGDYLVHQDHGVGRFAGLITQKIDNVSHEYLMITYAGGDKLYVPPYQINKLSKYVGASSPKINKLSGNTWPAMIKKVRKETIHLAHEIIELSAQRQIARAPIYKHKIIEAELDKSFEYTLTPDQISAWKDVEHDLVSGHPMDRLLCGDVAFGKTELALRTAYRAILNGVQVGLLAPTTILVQQHYDNFYKRLEPLGIKIGLLSRWQTAAETKKILEKLKTGEINIIIGTHRLLSRDVQFQNLGLLIIDEEQKFGVKDKDKLKKQRPLLHSLTMSATPIPRTLNYSLSGIRDISLIQTPPPGRLPITTNIIPHDNAVIKKAIETELARGGQIYYLVRKVKEIPAVVANLEKLNIKSRMSVAHGQLPPKNLAKIMSDFDHGEIDILVTSTIIENGLDVSNANTIIVDNAAHFGLSQLYQLRGRIGRGKNQGFAYLLFQRQKLTGIAAKRLQALQAAYELGAGFDIAVRDLEIRGAGNLLGKEQHGQITAIGLGLYTELLKESIEREKSSEDKKPRLDVTIDLPIPSTLENSKHLSTAQRIDVYQKLAWERNINDLEKLADKLLPTPRIREVENMIAILKLKLVAGNAGIYSIEAHKKSKQPFEAVIKLYLIPDHDKSGIRALLEHNDEWIYDGSVLKISTNYLGKDWLQKLIKNVEYLTKP